jgi:hypothetical protein
MKAAKDEPCRNKRSFWVRELEFLASAPDGEAEPRWLRLMSALGLPPTKKPDLASEKAGYLDVVAVVRKRQWKTHDNPLAYIMKMAARLHRQGELGPRGGIVTARGAHEQLRNPYEEDTTPVGPDAARVRLGMALEDRLSNVPECVPIADRFPEKYTLTFKLSPEDSADPDHFQRKAIHYERIAEDEGFDEFTRYVLLYRVRGISREKALRIELEKHGRFTMLATQSAWRDADRHGEWEAFQGAIKRVAAGADHFQLTIETRKAELRRRRNGRRGFLNLDQIAKCLEVKVSDVDDFFRSRKLRPVDGLVPPLFHPHSVDRFVKDHLSQKAIDDSSSNLASQAKLQGRSDVPYEWSAWVTRPVSTHKGKEITGRRK